MEEITQALWKASESRRACRIQLIGEPLSRTVYPYGICRTAANHITLVCWQTLGFTKAGGKAGFRNLLLNDIEEVETLDDHFDVHPDFNSADGLYKDWVYHI
jgi:hypothetical protein